MTPNVSFFFFKFRLLMGYEHANLACIIFRSNFVMIDRPVIAKFRFLILLCLFFSFYF